MIVTGEQLRAGRALVRLEQPELAKRANVSLGTVKRMEATVGPISANVLTLNAVVNALKAAGVIFVEENGDSPGVRRRKGKS
jgi:predicted transcriptional regulator